MSYNLITILGATASGKTKLAVRLADYFNGEIISADSRQVYRKMDIGTGKDLEDYSPSNIQVNYYLIDIVDPEDEFNLFEFKRKFFEAFNLITGKNKLPFLAGGSGLYLSAIVQNYSLKVIDFYSERAKELKKLELKELREIFLSKAVSIHNTTDLLDKIRIIKAILAAEAERVPVSSNPEIQSLTIGIHLKREEIKEKITDRLKQRLSIGMIEEVENLINSGVSYEKLNSLGLEYRYISLYLKGELIYDEMFQKLNHAIHNFAKRQMTWFRKMEREGVKIHWIEGPDFDAAKQIIESEINV